MELKEAELPSQEVHDMAIDDLVDRYAEQYKDWHHGGKWRTRARIENERMERTARRAALTMGGALVAAGLIEKATGIEVTPNLLANIHVAHIDQIGDYATRPETAMAVGMGFIGTSDVKMATKQNETNIGTLYLAKVAARDYAERIQSRLKLLRK